MRPSPRLLPLLALPLLGCPAYEGPIDVILVDLDDSAELSWAEAGSDSFAPCTNGTTHPEATAGCGPYGVGKPGDYTVRVTWQGVTVDKGVTLEKDRSYLANTEVEFRADEFVEG